MYFVNNEYVYLDSCCGAGTAADTEMVTLQISSQLELLRLNMDRQVNTSVFQKVNVSICFLLVFSHAWARRAGYSSRSFFGLATFTDITLICYISLR